MGRVDIRKTSKKYNIIYMNVVEKDLKRLKGSDITTLPIKDISKEDSVIFLWSGDKDLEYWIRVMNCWGFEYVNTAFVRTYGVAESGSEIRTSADYCLLGKRGKSLYILNKNISSIFPTETVYLSDEEAYENRPSAIKDHIIDILGDLPRIEFFNKDHREWDFV